MPTVRGKLPYLSSNQSQKEVTHNEALNILDILIDTTVISMSVSTPPGSPSAGDCYLVGSSATDDWLGEEGNLAFYLSGWNIIDSYKGLTIYNEADGKLYRHNGTSYSQLNNSIPAVYTNATATSSSDATTSDLILEELVDTDSGASVNTTIQIPANGILEAVTTRTVTAVTGASSYDCGPVGGTVDEFGSSLDISADSTNVGSINPTAYSSATAIKLTANGSDFTGGQVRVAIHCRVFQEPQE